ncbi:hypothetical protein STEG23_005518, partial [Scotinomys teguina]
MRRLTRRLALPIFGVIWITVLLFFWVTKRKLEVPLGPEVQTPKIENPKTQSVYCQRHHGRRPDGEWISVEDIPLEKGTFKSRTHYRMKGFRSTIRQVYKALICTDASFDPYCIPREMDVTPILIFRGRAKPDDRVNLDDIHFANKSTVFFGYLSIICLAHVIFYGIFSRHCQAVSLEFYQKKLKKLIYT